MTGDIQAAGKLLAELRVAYLSLHSQAQADVTHVLSSLVRAQAHAVVRAQEPAERDHQASCQSDSARDRLFPLDEPTIPSPRSARLHPQGG
jgi:hypothetical protein